VLVADRFNNRIRVLSADLQQASTVAGDGGEGHRIGAAAQAQIDFPGQLALLPDGRVLMTDYKNCIRVLSADLQQVSTLMNVDELNDPSALKLLPDGRLLVCRAMATASACSRASRPRSWAPSPPTSGPRGRTSSCRSAPSPVARARLVA
jgi:hypothetical protein